MSVTIYHNPACGTSRNTLELIRATGTEPKVVEYLTDPPPREELVSLIKRMKIAPRELLRRMARPMRNSALMTSSCQTSSLWTRWWSNLF